MADMSKRTATTAIAIAALTIELSGAQAPAEFRIIPAGEFRPWDGRPLECAAWVCNEEDGRRIVAWLNARTSDCVIDYEHATLRAKETCQAAPAAGWFKKAEWRDDGVWLVDVEWTALAAQQIADRQYRYVSPVFSYDPKSGHVQILRHASLTNDPGLDGLTDLAALAATLFTDQPQLEESAVNEELIEQLRWLLNLPVGATAEDIATHLSKLIGQLKSGNPTAANSAGFGLGEHLAALSAQVATPDPAKFVPVATLTALQSEHTNLQSQLATLSAEVNGGKLDKMVADGLASGKLTPAIESWARDLGKSNLAALSAYLEKAPVIVAPGQTQTQHTAPAGGGDGTLTTEQLAVCSALGLTKDQFIAANKEG